MAALIREIGLDSASLCESQVVGGLVSYSSSGIQERITNDDKSPVDVSSHERQAQSYARVKYDNFKENNVTETHATSPWCPHGVHQSGLNMAVLMGTEQDTRLPNSHQHNRGTVVAIRGNDFLDYNRLFHAPKSSTGNSRPPRRPQPSEASGRSINNADRNISNFSSKCRTPRQVSAHLDNHVHTTRDSPKRSATRFCDTHQWKSTDELYNRHQVAPDVLYRYTYGTARCEPSDLPTDITIPVRKMKPVSVDQESPQKNPDKWDPGKHLERLTQTPITSVDNLLPRLENKNNNNNKRYSGEISNASSTVAPESSPRSQRDNRILYSKVRSSIDLFQSYQSQVGSKPRPLSQETTGTLARYAYRRDTPKRGRSVAAMDYIVDTGYPRLRRSQTAPSMLGVTDGTHRSADTYMQYMEQSRTIGNTPGLSHSVRFYGNRRPTLPKQDMKSSRCMRTPPSTPQFVTPNNAIDDVERIRSEVKGMMLLQPEHNFVPDRSVDTTNMKSKTSAHQQYTKVVAKSGDKSSRAKPVRNPDNAGNSDTLAGDVITEGLDIEENVKTLPKREVITVDLRSAVGDSMDDENDTIVALHYEI